jgi:hypothetical protein
LHEAGTDLAVALAALNGMTNPDPPPKTFCVVLFDGANPMVDRYTKFILTVIACLLAVVVVRDIPVVSRALAQVELYNDTLPVTIRAIDPTRCFRCRWDPLPVKVVQQ